MVMKSYSSVDQHITSFPPEIQKILKKVRQTIQKVLPEATERISYGIPTYTLKRNIVHWSGYDKYIGFYPGSIGIRDFAKELEPYETSKGTVRFFYDQPIPYDLIAKITKHIANVIDK